MPLRRFSSLGKLFPRKPNSDPYGRHSSLARHGSLVQIVFDVPSYMIGQYSDQRIQ
jgi:hypothetical protein